MHAEDAAIAVSHAAPQVIVASAASYSNARYAQVRSALSLATEAERAARAWML